MCYFVGIDVAKKRHAAVILDQEGHKLRRLSVDNSRDSFERFTATLRQLGGPVRVAMESTSCYWLALHEHLSSAGFEVCVFNPLQIHAWRKTCLRKTKTDPQDAFHIAEFLRIGAGPALVVPDAQLQSLRQLARLRFSLVDQVSDHKRRIQSLLDRVFPEYAGAFTGVFLAASRAVLETAPTPDEVVRHSVEELTAIIRTASRNHLGGEQAQKVLEAAHDSIGVRSLARAATIEIRCLLKQMEFLEGQVDELDQEIAKLMAHLPQQQITSVPGVGPVLGAAILGEIGDIARFGSIKSLVAYAGLDASIHESGQFSGSKMHISKRGSPHLRRALWLAANIARQCDPELSAFYQRKLAEGKHYGTILGALCRKLLGRIYVVLKEQKVYTPRMTEARVGA